MKTSMYVGSVGKNADIDEIVVGKRKYVFGDAAYIQRVGSFYIKTYIRYLVFAIDIYEKETSKGFPIGKKSTSIPFIRKYVKRESYTNAYIDLDTVIRSSFTADTSWVPQHEFTRITQKTCGLDWKVIFINIKEPM